MDINLNDFSLKELRDLHGQVGKAILTFEERRMKAAYQELEEKAREMGFSLADLAKLSGTRAKSSGTAKYANPANPADTWTGRGRKPRWFVEALASGKTAEDLAV